MMDLLERLRSVQGTCVQYTQGSDIMRDAADEIETIRARVAELEASAMVRSNKYIAELAAHDLVIKQLQSAIKNHSGNYKLTKSECAEINRVVALQPTTAALDAYVAERTAEIEAQRDWLANDAGRFKAIADMWLWETVNERQKHANARKLTQDAFKKSALASAQEGAAK